MSDGYPDRYCVNCQQMVHPALADRAGGKGCLLSIGVYLVLVTFGWLIGYPSLGGTLALIGFVGYSYGSRERRWPTQRCPICGTTNLQSFAPGHRAEMELSDG